MVAGAAHPGNEQRALKGTVHSGWSAHSRSCTRARCLPSTATGQFGRVIGYIEPLEEGAGANTVVGEAPSFKFVNKVRACVRGGGVEAGCVAQRIRALLSPTSRPPRCCRPCNQMSGNNIPPEYYGAIEKGFREAANSGALIGAPVEVRRTRACLCPCFMLNIFTQFYTFPRSCGVRPRPRTAPVVGLVACLLLPCSAHHAARALGLAQP